MYTQNYSSKINFQCRTEVLLIWYYVPLVTVRCLVQNLSVLNTTTTYLSPSTHTHTPVTTRSLSPVPKGNLNSHPVKTSWVHLCSPPRVRMSSSFEVWSLSSCVMDVDSHSFLFKGWPLLCPILTGRGFKLIQLWSTDLSSRCPVVFDSSLISASSIWSLSLS